MRPTDCDIGQDPPPVEGLDGRGGEATQPERRTFEGRVRTFVALQDDNGRPGQAQFGRKEQADRSGPDDRHVVPHDAKVSARQ
jgi:hypothetical protein